MVHGTVSICFPIEYRCAMYAVSDPSTVGDLFTIRRPSCNDLAAQPQSPAPSSEAFLTGTGFWARTLPGEGLSRAHSPPPRQGLTSQLQIITGCNQYFQRPASHHPIYHFRWRTHTPLSEFLRLPDGGSPRGSSGSGRYPGVIIMLQS